MENEPLNAHGLLDLIINVYLVVSVLILAVAFVVMSWLWIVHVRPRLVGEQGESPALPYDVNHYLDTAYEPEYQARTMPWLAVNDVVEAWGRRWIIHSPGQGYSDWFLQDADGNIMGPWDACNMVFVHRPCQTTDSAS